VVRQVPSDSDRALVAVFQRLAAPSGVGNGDGVIHTVSVMPSATSVDLSRTDREFPPHTDSTFLRDPRHFVVLACIERAPDSGGA
jgi:alpha-ketoglutarate-dependent taurine dioxygenase